MIALWGRCSSSRLMRGSASGSSGSPANPMPFPRETITTLPRSAASRTPTLCRVKHHQLMQYLPPALIGRLSQDNSLHLLPLGLVWETSSAVARKRTSRR